MKKSMIALGALLTMAFGFAVPALASHCCADSAPCCKAAAECCKEH